MFKKNVENFIEFRSDQNFGLNLLKMIGMIFISVSHYGIIVGSKERDTFALSNFMIVMINSLYAVDLFFVVSGYIIGQKIQQLSFHKRFFVLLDRFLRIFPLYWITLLIYIILPKLTNSGYEENCVDNIFYISTLTHNIFNKFGCFEWSWYIAVEFQSLILIILILSSVSKKHYSRIITLLLISSILYSLYICLKNNFKISYFAMQDKNYYYNFYQRVEFKIPSYLIGFLVGHRNYNITKKKNMSPYSLTISLMLLIISLFFWVHIWKYEELYSDYLQNIYQALSRPLFCFAIVNLDVTTIKANYICQYLLQMISKILFSIYLLHYFLFQFLISNNILEKGLIFNFLGYFIIIVLTSLLFHIFVEQTILQYVRIVRKLLLSSIKV